MHNFDSYIRLTTCGQLFEVENKGSNCNKRANYFDFFHAGVVKTGFLSLTIDPTQQVIALAGRPENKG